MNSTFKKGLLGIVMGATSLGWSQLMPPVTGNEDYIKDRIEVQEPRKKDYSLKHQMAYVAKTREEYVAEAQTQREDGRKLANGLGYIFMGTGLIALLAGLYTRKTE